MIAGFEKDKSTQLREKPESGELIDELIAGCTVINVHSDIV